MTQLALQTLTNRLRRRIYRSPTSGTYPSDPRRCRSAAARSSQRCRGRQTRSFSTKLGNITTNGYVYATLSSIIHESTRQRPHILGSPLWRQVALQLRKVRDDGCQAIRGNAAPSGAYRSLRARLNRASRAWQHPCCNLSVLQSRGDGGPTAGARPRGEPLCERRMEESASPT